MTTTGTCQHCGTIFVKRRASQQCCSKSCARRHDARQRTTYAKKTCIHCGKQWEARTRYHGAKYCSKSCEFAHRGYVAKRERPCKHCGKPFLSSFRKERGSWERFCSRACVGHHLHHEKATEKTCAVCGTVFEVTPSREHYQTCSRACRNKRYVRDRTAPWKGGVVEQDGRIFRRIDREGYAGMYEGEHRLIAARVIGRPLVRGEVVICINGDNQDWRPENLFICPTVSAWSLIRNGAAEWPSASNLEEYRERGYVPTPVRIVLHEWENGQRRSAKSGRPIHRHPQADEIIKRRMAGASIRVLAAEFESSESAMGYALKHRL